MIVKRFDVEGSLAYTLSAEEVFENHDSQCGGASRTHADGWKISGDIHEDYFYWVNDFEATHPVFGRVWGNFESEVSADSEAAYQDFFEKHTPESWDYWDI
jgi:hypothetical protein